MSSKLQVFLAAEMCMLLGYTKLNLTQIFSKSLSQNQKVLGSAKPSLNTCKITKSLDAMLSHKVTGAATKNDACPDDEANITQLHKSTQICIFPVHSFLIIVGWSSDITSNHPGPVICRMVTNVYRNASVLFLCIYTVHTELIVKH